MARGRRDGLLWAAAALAVLAAAVAAATVPALVAAGREGLGALRGRRSTLERAAVGGGRLPLLRDVRLEALGVRRPRRADGATREQLPYAARHTFDRTLRDALAGCRFVLVHGPSAAGKSRSVAEAARRLWPDRRVLVPDPERGRLAEVLGSGARLDEVVVWLDDLNEHLAAGLTAELVHRLLDRPGLRVVATMRSAAYANYQARGGIRAPEADVLDLADEVEFAGWDGTDRAAACVTFADQPDVTAALGRGLGLGEYLSAGPELVARLERRTLVPAEVAGRVIVRAAADWYRAGLDRPAPLPLVQRLYPAYLPDDDASLLDQFDAGLAWATDPATGWRMLTNRTDGAGLAVHDYLLDHLATTLTPGLPTTTWAAIADQLAAAGDVDALTRAGATAYLTHHEPAAAEQLTRTAADAGHTGAMYNLGVLLAERDESAEAERWSRAAARAGDADAMYNLGVLLRARGDLAGAERYWRTAVLAGNVSAMYNLGLLLAHRGQLAEAMWHWRAAAAGGDTDAMHNLGVVLRARGEPAEAERWFRAAADTGDERRPSTAGRENPAGPGRDRGLGTV